MWRVAMVGATAGCAHATFEARIEPLGPYRPSADLAAAAAAIPARELAAVSVWRGPLPPGLLLDGDELRVTDPDRYELVGRVTAGFSRERALASSLSLGFYRYEAGWRNPYCNVQVPLGWVTAGLWTAVPLHWPCWIVETNDADAIVRRRDAVLEALVRGAKAAGGDLLVVGWIGAGPPGEPLPAGALQDAAGAGFALRDRAR